LIRHGIEPFFVVNEPSKPVHAFKEWSSVCGLLERGCSSLLLRKGGIHEGREGFSFKHREFFLFPTAFHEQADGLTMPVALGNPPAADPEGNVTIRIWARAQWATLLRDWKKVELLGPFHPWSDEVVRERFTYSEKLEADCISVAFVRIFRLAEPWVIPYQRNFGGCRSWLELPAPPDSITDDMQPVVDDTLHASRASALKSVLSA